jgi:hypothetical protein
MDMWTIFAIALAAMVVALVLAYVLKSRLSDDDVWQELVDPDAPPEDTESYRPLSDVVRFTPAEESPRLGVESMPVNSSVPPSSCDADLRRSSRLEEAIPMVVLGINRRGETFQERTSAVSFNLHGCRYASRHDYPLEGWVTLQVTGTDGAAAPPVRARVRSVLSPQSSRELCQVGVELETPANIWGVHTPPEDWQRLLGSSGSGARAAAATAPALDPSAPPSSFAQRAAAQPDRRAEVAVFPSPAVPETKEAAAVPKPERVTFTPEQLLHALQGKLQLAADRAVETALSARLDESVKLAMGKIEESWRSNQRQTEEFSASRLADVQKSWQRELVVYQGRAEEISKRLEGLASSSRQGLIELQKFAEHIKNEVEPQLNARLDESFTRAHTDFETKSNQLAERHKAKIAEFAQFAALQARSQLDETVAEAHSLVSAAKAAPPSGVSEEQLESALSSSSESTLSRVEQRLSDFWTRLQQQQELTRHRSDEIAQHIETLSTQLREAKAHHELAFSDIRSTVAASTSNGSPERLDSLMKGAKEHIFNHLEWRLGEVTGHADQQDNALHQRFDGLARRVEDLAGDSAATRARSEQTLSDLCGRVDQQQNVTQQRSDELGRRLDAVVADSAAARLQAEQVLAEARSLLNTPHSGGLTEENLNGALNSLREQLHSNLEWRLGEISGQFQLQHDAVLNRADEMAHRFDAFADDMRAQVNESRANAEALVHELRPQNLIALDQSVERAAKEFEVSAARISDRQLVRLMQQKQALSAEAGLELEARLTETRSLLQKAANSSIDEFRRQVESQIDLIIAESTERVSSALASLDAESRATCEARRRDVETDVARAAEQSTAEFRSGIKAFLYSCLVAAVSAVDEHAQTTLGGLAKNPNGSLHAIDNQENAESGSTTPASTPNPRS